MSKINFLQLLMFSSFAHRFLFAGGACDEQRLGDALREAVEERLQAEARAEFRSQLKQRLGLRAWVVSFSVCFEKNDDVFLPIVQMVIGHVIFFPDVSQFLNINFADAQDKSLPCAGAKPTQPRKATRARCLGPPVGIAEVVLLLLPVVFSRRNGGVICKKKHQR